MCAGKGKQKPRAPRAVFIDDSEQVLELLVDLFGPDENGGDLNQAVLRIKREDNAMAPYTFAEDAFEFTALDREDISPEGIVPHLLNRLAELFLMVSRQATELLCGFLGKSTVPGHV